MKIASRQVKVSVYDTAKLHDRLKELKEIGGQEAVNAMFTAVGRMLLWNLVSDNPFDGVKMNIDAKDMEVLCTYTDSNKPARTFAMIAVYRGPLPDDPPGTLRDGAKTWSFHS